MKWKNYSNKKSKQRKKLVTINGKTLTKGFSWRTKWWLMCGENEHSAVRNDKETKNVENLQWERNVLSAMGEEMSSRVSYSNRKTEEWLAARKIK